MNYVSFNSLQRINSVGCLADLKINTSWQKQDECQA